MNRAPRFAFVATLLAISTHAQAAGPATEPVRAEEAAKAFIDNAIEDVLKADTMKKTPTQSMSAAVDDYMARGVPRDGRWLQLHSERGLDYLVDLHTIEVDSERELVTIWTKIVDVDGSTVANMRAFCRDKTYQLGNETTRDKAGRALETQNGWGPVEAAAPDSAAELISNWACS